MNFITILGLAAAACTTISFLPQAVKTIRTKHTEDLSLGMYSLLTIGIFLWLLYGILVEDIPIIVANGVTIIFCLTILFLIIKYR
jgi:MtN3 and saliva related transmembrane protein